MKHRPRIVILAVLGLTLVSLLAQPEGPPGVRRLAGWTLGPLLRAVAALRVDRVGDEGGGDAEAWRRAWLQERARSQELLERLRAIPDLRGLSENPSARRNLELGRPRILLGRIVHRDATPLRNGVLIDVGEEDGVVPGLPVTVGNALVGVVVRVWSGRVSQVRLLDDPQMRLRVAVQTGPANGEAADADPDRGADGPTLRPGNLEGLTGGRLRLRFARGPGIEEGAPVVTTADSWWIPPFLIAGTVAEVTDRDHDGVAEVRVRPAASLDGISVVSVWRRPDPPPGPWREER